MNVYGCIDLYMLFNDGNKFTSFLSLAYYKRPKKNWQPALRMYRGWFLIVAMTGLLGINIYGWSKAGVNHKLIFELDPRDHLTYIDLLKVRKPINLFVASKSFCSYF